MAGKRSTNLKATAATVIDDCKVELQELGSQIRENPEIGFEEVKAHKILTRLVLALIRARIAYIGVQWPSCLSLMELIKATRYPSKNQT